MVDLFPAEGLIPVSLSMTNSTSYKLRLQNKTIRGLVLYQNYIILIRELSNKTKIAIDILDNHLVVHYDVIYLVIVSILYPIIIQDCI